MTEPAQLNLPLLGTPPDVLLNLGTPRDIWLQMNSGLVSHLAENRRVEFKSLSRIDLDRISEYLRMYSNTSDGGVLLLGVENDGTISGCSDLGEDRLNCLEKIHVQRCPQARPEFKRIPVAEGSPEFFYAVFVPYIGILVENKNGDAFIRFGDSKHRMSESEKDDFRSTRHERSFEQRPCDLKYPDEFDTEILDEFCRQFTMREPRPGWSREEILSDRILGERAHDGSFEPYNALALLAANRPRKTIPGCRIRLQRFPGTDEGDGATYSPTKDRYVEGNIVQLIDQCKGAISEAMYDVTWLGQDGKFVTTPEYPHWAWLECLVNACVHRSYTFSGSEITIKFFQDRLEIESPGGFVPPVTPETIYDLRTSRNPNLMDALRSLGYVKMAREGVRRIRSSMKDWDLPDPVFQEEEVHGVAVRVTLRNDFETRKRTTNREVAQHFGVDAWRSLSEYEITILAYAFHNQTINVSEPQRLTGRTWATSKKDLGRLANRGFFTFVPGKYVRDSTAHYSLEKPREAFGNGKSNIGDET